MVLGLGGRVGGVEEVPAVLERWDVLAVAGLLYAFEFVADKIGSSTRAGTPSRR